jgi:succinoglycan biosynthesis protein ExoM
VSQVVPNDIELRVIVADNSKERYAENLVVKIAVESSVPVSYIHAPQANISTARNACLNASQADWIVFIDDDEVASENWLLELWSSHATADVVFGEVRAVYPKETPSWIRENDIHSTRITSEVGKVKTGFAGNVMMRWHGTRWSNQRFDLALGRTGGEDTAFFNALYRAGATLTFNSAALVFEPVAPERLSLIWMVRRKFRSGQSHSDLSLEDQSWSTLCATALAKSLVCSLVALATFLSPVNRGFWGLRAAFHFGVFAGCLKAPKLQHSRSST